MQDPCIFKFALELLKPRLCDMEGRYPPLQLVGPMQDTCSVWQMCFLDPVLGNAPFLLSLWKWY